MNAVETAERHERRLAWAEVVLRSIGLLTGFAIAVVLALVAEHLADKGAATQGAGIFGAGAASIISAAFALGRTRKP
jgi:ABC-type Co2+ transport system permease subunit